jgi:hypothetical protein
MTEPAKGRNSPGPPPPDHSVSAPLWPTEEEMIQAGMEAGRTREEVIAFLGDILKDAKGRQ